MRILFICPDFFNYDKIIEERLKARGHFVVAQNEVPCSTIKKYSLFSRLGKSVRQYLWRKYEKKTIRNIINNKITTLFIIRGSQIPEPVLRNIVNSAKIEVIQYQWDSITNNPNSLMLAKYATSSYTFDLKDSIYNSNFKYLPLFYDWGNCLIDETVPSYDITYVCSWSDNRLKIMEELRLLSKINNISLYAYIYIPFQTFLRLIIKRRDLPLQYIHFSSLSRNKYYNLLSKSKLTVDVPSSTQVGASMRTIEALSVNTALLTTNKNLQNEKFFSSEVIKFWPISNANLQLLLNTGNKHFPKKGIYSLDEWLDFMCL